MAKTKGTILVADDHSYNWDLIGAFLELGFPEYAREFFVSGDALQGKLEQLINNPDNVKLVITDNTMKPGKTGSELIAEYAHKFEFPFVLHSGIDEIGAAAKNTGAFDYLKKPVSFNDFKKVIGRALEYKKQD